MSRWPYRGAQVRAFADKLAVARMHRAKVASTWIEARGEPTPSDAEVARLRSQLAAERDTAAVRRRREAEDLRDSAMLTTGAVRMHAAEAVQMFQGGVELLGSETPQVADLAKRTWSR